MANKVYRHNGKDFIYSTDMLCDMVGCGVFQDGVHQKAVGVAIPREGKDYPYDEPDYYKRDECQEEWRPYTWCEHHGRQVAGKRFILFEGLPSPWCPKGGQLCK